MIRVLRCVLQEMKESKIQLRGSLESAPSLINIYFDATFGVPNLVSSSLRIYEMTLRVLPRVVRAHVPKRFVPTWRLYQGRRYSNAATETKNSQTSPAKQAPTSEASSPKDVPLTIESHGPVTQNPKHTKQVVSLL
jgi:hypothetical protein